MKTTISDVEDEKVVKKILDEIVSYNQSKVQRDVKPLLVSITENGQLIAGAQCASGYGWVHVKLLWVDDNHRKRGLGSKIMREVEKEALKRGCAGVHLDTFGFQAPDFYKKLGYEVFGTIDDHPKGIKRYYLSKRLSD